MQNDLILDYRTNVAPYPQFQQYLRDNQPPLMAVWGKNDQKYDSPKLSQKIPPYCNDMEFSSYLCRQQTGYCE